ncbi:hypothetical protein B0T10DRAFT_313984 [Thelonectria olida]|uniref:PD-(D/E)XK nuclease-like domain-containing protein n=1 Tax=Thelonectria olida TaxID=1576542 RepID=A0A9P8VMQ6_9HYPO|nr:hypothetical protein B0T10DRAFT_313984 [Thelonectria olida]
MRHRAANELSRMTQQVTNMPGSAQDAVLSSLDQAAQLPDYLPGIIIQGHDWHLVITTREGDKTMFWQKMTFGSTSSSKGIYQIICTLQLLGRWARDEYWPWLRGVVSEWPCYDGQTLII